MKICILSDLHGILPKLDSDIELLLICGDISPVRHQRDLEYCLYWFNDTFVKWINKYNITQTYFIAGNHDFFLRDCSDLLELPNNIKYIKDELVNYKGISIYGTPWCKLFGNWPFMIPFELLDKYFKKIPQNLDILLTHDAPFGTSDVLLQRDCAWYTPEHIGNSSLREIIQKIQPKYNFHGHLHSTNHECEMLNNTKVYNVSIVDENYENVYKPTYINYDNRQNT